MKTNRFEVLSAEEIQQIHAASMEILATVGVKCDYALARQIFAKAGASVDEATQSVRMPEALVMQAISTAPKSFRLYGADGKFSVLIGGGEPVFAALGTPTSSLDLETGAHRPSSLQDLVHHIQLIDSSQNIHCGQMDVWPNDVPMTTIHTEAIWAWAHHSRKAVRSGLLRLPSDPRYAGDDGDRLGRQAGLPAETKLLWDLLHRQPAADDHDPIGRYAALC
jgi:trimethylamine:corrinoid methyltransferase-like protein